MKTIEENSQMIADFIGIEYAYDKKEGAYYDKKTGDLIGAAFKFNTSWDWLMPVVEKIEEIPLEEVEGSYKVHRFNVKIESFYCIITDVKDEHRELIVADDGDKRSNVYYAVVEFIKWYNENK